MGTLDKLVLVRVLVEVEVELHHTMTLIIPITTVGLAVVVVVPGGLVLAGQMAYWVALQELVLQEAIIIMVRLVTVVIQI